MNKPHSNLTGLEFSVRGRLVQLKQSCKDGSSRVIVADRDEFLQAVMPLFDAEKHSKEDE